MRTPPNLSASEPVRAKSRRFSFFFPLSKASQQAEPSRTGIQPLSGVPLVMIVLVVVTHNSTTKKSQQKGLRLRSTHSVVPSGYLSVTGKGIPIRECFETSFFLLHHLRRRSGFTVMIAVAKTISPSTENGIEPTNRGSRDRVVRLIARH